jgi:hypothetical protein
VYGHKVVMKGRNAEERAEILRSHWDEFRDPVCISLDASRFDQHVSTQALQFEHSIYNSIYRDDELRRALRMQVNNRGVARTAEGIVKYQVEGHRMSGDMNTSLGNVILMCAMVYAYTRTLGIKCRVADDGDDCLLFIERRHLPLTANLRGYFREFGFTMKVEEAVDEFEQVSFCQCSPLWVGDRWLMVRQPRAGLAKDSTWLQPDLTGAGLLALRSWTHCVGKCGLSMTGGVPIYQELYGLYIRNGLAGKGVQGFGGMTSGFEYMAARMSRSQQAISPATRASFYYAFGITPDQQIALEKHLGALPEWCEGAPLTPVEDYPGLPYLL